MNIKFFRKITTSFANPDDFQDASEVYGDQKDDENTDCLCLICETDFACGEMRCVWCRRRVA